MSASSVTSGGVVGGGEEDQYVEGIFSVADFWLLCSSRLARDERIGGLLAGLIQPTETKVCKTGDINRAQRGAVRDQTGRLADRRRVARALSSGRPGSDAENQMLWRKRTSAHRARILAVFPHVPGGRAVAGSLGDIREVQHRRAGTGP